MNKTMDESSKDIKTDHQIKSRRVAWWKESQTASTENKVLKLISIIVTIGLILVLIALYIRTRQEKSVRKDNICLTKDCVTTAADILMKLDNTVNPCDNFYNFACGTYVKRFILPEDKSSITPLSFARDLLTEKLRTLVDQEPQPDDTESTKGVRNLYASCMDTELLNRKGIKPLLKTLEEIGGWPVLEEESWDESQFDFVDWLVTIRQLGFSSDYFFTLSVSTDMKNSSWRIITFDQAEVGMPSREYMIKGLNDSDVQAYLKYQVNLAVALGANKDLADKEMRENVELEIQLANETLPEAERRDVEKLYNKMTISELQALVPSLPWLKIVNEFLDTNETITEDEPIIVHVPKFMQYLGNWVQLTPKRKLANLMLWHVAAMTVPYLSQEMRDIQLQYSKKISGAAKEAPRWKTCMHLVSDELPYAVGALYVRHFFNEKSKREAESMVTYIHNAFTENLRTVPWMDDSTRRQAIKKSHAIKPLIGYPREILNETILMDHLPDLQLNSDDLYGNIANISIHNRLSESRDLRKKVIKSDWKVYGDAAVVNAFYSPVDNAILFPAGILQNMFFSINRPKYLNYGSIGLIIGHEITHGFDDEGSQFNENGELINWWEPDTRQKFVNKSQCIIEQYSSYSIPEINLKINGIVTQGENIADNGGMKTAYEAYNRWVDDHDEEPILPGLPYTSRQLFWISAAHLWCSKSRDEYLKLSVLSRVHSPPRYRINGPMRNLPQFSNDWGCPQNTFMNPASKCAVW